MSKASNQCHLGDCDRKQGHPGFCMKRCAKSAECLDRQGHRGRCSPSTYLSWGWALTEDTLCPSVSVGVPCDLPNHHEGPHHAEIAW